MFNAQVRIFTSRSLWHKVLMLMGIRTATEAIDYLYSCFLPQQLQQPSLPFLVYHTQSPTTSIFTMPLFSNPNNTIINNSQITDITNLNVSGPTGKLNQQRHRVTKLTYCRD